VNAILDNLTETNREFADVRIAELKGELKRIEPRMAELEAPAGASGGGAAVKDERIYLEHILECIEWIRRFTGGGREAPRVACSNPGVPDKLLAGRSRP